MTTSTRCMRKVSLVQRDVAILAPPALQIPRLTPNRKHRRESCPRHAQPAAPLDTKIPRKRAAGVRAAAAAAAAAATAAVAPCGGHCPRYLSRKRSLAQASTPTTANRVEGNRGPVKWSWLLMIVKACQRTTLQINRAIQLPRQASPAKMHGSTRPRHQRRNRHTNHKAVQHLPAAFRRSLPTNLQHNHNGLAARQVFCVLYVQQTHGQQTRNG